jgi:hypothetical protein
MINKYTNGANQVIKECEEALLSIMKCQAGDCKCAPNDSDFDLVRKALYSISVYKEMRRIK